MSVSDCVRSVDTMNIPIGNEGKFIEYAEKFVYDLSMTFRKMQMLDNFAVIEVCSRLEELIYNQAVKNNEPLPNKNVWEKRAAIECYQANCDKVLDSLSSKQLNFVRYFTDNDANSLLIALNRDGNAPSKSAPKRKNPSSSSTVTSNRGGVSKKSGIQGFNKYVNGSSSSSSSSNAVKTNRDSLNDIFSPALLLSPNHDSMDGIGFDDFDCFDDYENSNFDGIIDDSVWKDGNSNSNINSSSSSSNKEQQNKNNVDSDTRSNWDPMLVDDDAMAINAAVDMTTAGHIHHDDEELIDLLDF